MRESLGWFIELFPALFGEHNFTLRALAYILFVLLVAGGLLIGTYVLSRWLEKKYLLSSVSDGPNKDKVVRVVRDIFFYVLATIISLSAIHFLGFNVDLLMAALAFGLGFAFKDLLSNTLAGMLILTNNDYKLGEIIEIDGPEGDYFGRIEELTIRYLVIRTVDLRRVVIPNIIVVTYPVRTYEIEDSVRYEIHCTLHYTTDIALADQVITQAVQTVAIVNHPELTKVMVQSLGPDGIHLLIYAHVDPKCGKTKKRIKGVLSQAIFQALREHEIVIVHPHRSMGIEPVVDESSPIFSLI